MVNPLIAEDLGLSVDTSWANRHTYASFWKDWCNKFREDDSLKLVKLCISKADLVVGLRDRTEIIEGRKQGLLDLVIWIDNRRVPADPTLTFTADDCDLVVLNNSTLDEFYSKLFHLIKLTKLINKEYK